MSLKNWLRNGWLVEHKTSREEISDLLGIAERDLKDSRAKAISADWRLAIAYNAALQVAAAALAASGYRASREAHHFRTIQSMAFTIEADPALVGQLDAFRKKRNISDYERVGAVSDQEAEEMAALAERLRTLLKEWLRARHPNLA